MTCGEFLALHSEYLDGHLGAEMAAELRRHLAECARCARYDRVLRRGLTVLRGMEPVLPSRDAYLEVQRRLGQSTGAITRPRLPIAASVAVAGVVALVAWSALVRVTGVPTPAVAESARPAARQVGSGDSALGRMPAVRGGEDVLGRVVGVPRRVDFAPVALMDEAADTAGSGLAGVRVETWRATAASLPVQEGTLVSGGYTPLMLEAPEFGQGVQVIPVVGPAPH